MTAPAAPDLRRAVAHTVLPRLLACTLAGCLPATEEPPDDTFVKVAQRLGASGAPASGPAVFVEIDNPANASGIGEHGDPRCPEIGAQATASFGGEPMAVLSRGGRDAMGLCHRQRFVLDEWPKGRTGAATFLLEDGTLVVRATFPDALDEPALDVVPRRIIPGTIAQLTLSPAEFEITSAWIWLGPPWESAIHWSPPPIVVDGSTAQFAFSHFGFATGEGGLAGSIQVSARRSVEATECVGVTAGCRLEALIAASSDVTFRQ